MPIVEKWPKYLRKDNKKVCIISLLLSKSHERKSNKVGYYGEQKMKNKNEVETTINCSLLL